MQPTPATFQADEHLAQHLLSLGFAETTGSAYHPERWLSVPQSTAAR